MNKFEFLTKIDIELEKLEKEEKELNSKMEFYNAVDPTSYKNEIEEIKKRLNEIVTGKAKLEDVIGFPAYARIMTMSSAEIEEYKKEKVSEIDSKIAVLNAKLEKDLNKKEEYEKIEKELLEKFTSSTDEEEKERIIEEAREVKQEIYSLEKESRENIKNQQKQLDDLINQKNEISNKNDEEIKESITRDYIKDCDKYKDIYFEQKYDGPDEIDEFLVYLVENLDHNELYDIGMNMYQWVRSDNELKSAEREATEFNTERMFSKIPCSKSFGLRDNVTMSYESAFEILDKIDQGFQWVNMKGTSPFLDQSAMMQVGRLHRAYKKNDTFSDEIFLDEAEKNIILFSKYCGYLDNGVDSELAAAYQEYCRYDGKRFLSRKQKAEKEELERTIIERSKEIYKNLEDNLRKTYDEYLYQQEDIFDIFNTNLQSFSFDYFLDYHKSVELTEHINKVQTEINKARDALLNKFVESKEKVDNINQQKISAEQRIKNKADEGYGDISIRSIITRVSGDVIKLNYEENIKQAAVKSKEKIERANMLGGYIEKAQNESDIREAEIKDITLEELLAQKRAALMEKKNIQKDDNAPFERIEDDPSVTPRTIS